MVASSGRLLGGSVSDRRSQLKASKLRPMGGHNSDIYVQLAPPAGRCRELVTEATYAEITQRQEISPTCELRLKRAVRRSNAGKKEPL
jgi:hypothetical protein